MHDVIVVGLPLLAIFAGILFNRNDIRELRNEMRAEIAAVRGEISALRSEMRTEIGVLRSEMRTEIGVLRSEMYGRFDKVDQQLDGIDADLRQFYHLAGKLEADVEMLKKR